MNQANIEAQTQAINEFVKNLLLCCDDTDKKQSVIYLAAKVGKDKANTIAVLYGLSRDYYMVK